MKHLFNLISYLTLFLFSLNTFAYGEGVQVLSSKTTMSPGMHGGFVENTSQPNLTGNGNAKAYADAKPAFGNKSDNITINGSHSFVIENRSGKAQRYMIEYKLSLHDGRFIRKSDIVLVNDKAVAKGSATSYTNQYFPQPGTYRFSVETSISGEHSDYKSDSSYVQVR